MQLQNQNNNSHKEIMHLCIRVTWVTIPAYCQHDPCPLKKFVVERRSAATRNMYLVVVSKPNQNISQIEQLKVKVHTQNGPTDICLASRSCLQAKQKLDTKKEHTYIGRRFECSLIFCYFVYCPSLSVAHPYTQNEIKSGVSPKKQYSSNHW